ncbi:MAG: SPOR domain-containing protein [Halobacteriovoraceae bacterium]|nr:SPOR domain-containing protein [Halobacteriovoraceae bacterium]
MGQKPNFYVFARIEVFLVFMLMIFVAVTAFIFGVKMGKEHYFEEQGLTRPDREKVELMSGQEEILQKEMQEKKKSKKKNKKSEIEKTYSKLKEEFNRLKKHERVADRNSLNNRAFYNRKIPKKKLDDFSGKHTIQLGSYRSIGDAKEFADGFRVRGYNPIINEVAVKGRGTWYRISLGVFNTVSEAKKYIIKEKTLFKGQDYVIAQFD